MPLPPPSSCKARRPLCASCALALQVQRFCKYWTQLLQQGPVTHQAALQTSTLVRCIGGAAGAGACRDCDAGCWCEELHRSGAGIASPLRKPHRRGSQSLAQAPTHCPASVCLVTCIRYGTRDHAYGAGCSCNLLGLLNRQRRHDAQHGHPSISLATALRPSL